MKDRQTKTLGSRTHKRAGKRRIVSPTWSPGKRRQGPRAPNGQAGARNRNLELGTQARGGSGNGSQLEYTTALYRFEDERYYRTSDPELAVIASRGTLAKWRCMGIGPPFIRFGGRILYLGKDLNDWLDQHRVKTFQN